MLHEGYMCCVACWSLEWLLLPVISHQLVHPDLTSSEMVAPVWKPHWISSLSAMTHWNAHDCCPHVPALNFRKWSSLRQRALMCWAEAMWLVGYLFSFEKQLCFLWSDAVGVCVYVYCACVWGEGEEAGVCRIQEFITFNIIHWAFGHVMSK